MTPKIFHTVLKQTFITHLEVFLLFQCSCDQTRSFYCKCTPLLTTGLSGWADKKSGINSKLRGQDALVWDVPARGTVLSDSQMGLDWTGWSVGNIFVVGLFIMRTSGGEHVIVGRECNECVDNCTAGMREITDKYTENVTNMARGPIKEHNEQQITKVL